jgi:uncharacterized protein YdhG (YjbR/CyaY superfamily)
MEKISSKENKNLTGGKKKSEGFTEVERAAMKERAKELKAAERGNKNREEGEKAVLAKIAEMEEADRVIAERIHKIVNTNAPDLITRTWYGMPAYSKDDKVVCFFQDAQKFKTRYSTLGFNDSALLDEGTFWPTAYALTELTPKVEKQITELVIRAVS